MKKVTKAIIPCAGLGTRFLPETKAVPKEMLPIVDTPGLQYIIEEAVEAGITDILIVTNKNKKCIEDHFDVSIELERTLEKEGKDELLALARKSSSLANIHYIRQGEPKGLAHAVSFAKAFACGEPIALMLGDDMVYTEKGKPTCIGQLLDCFESTGIPTIATMKVAPEEVKKYGNIAISNSEGKKHYVSNIVEKPKDGEKLSDNVIIGRYVLPSNIFDVLESTPPTSSGEVYLTDALITLANTCGLIGYEFDGIRYDTGDKLGYLQANVEYALRDEKLGEKFREYLEELLK